MSKIISKRQQKMYDALEGVSTIIGGYIYRLIVPKRLQRSFEQAHERESDGKKLSAMEKTRLYGYLNPKYRAATSPRKRIR